jgi:hypothetical protein
MRRPRRFAAVAAVLLFLQLVVLGSGIACAMPAAMPGMDAQGASAMAPMDNHAPCHIPWAPADCNGTMPCAPAAMTSRAIALLPAPPIPHDEVRLVMLAPSSITAPPELPPPRA